MKYAIINLLPIIVRPPVIEKGITVLAAVVAPAGLVVNVIEWDGVSQYDPGEGTETVKWDNIAPVDGKPVAGSHAALWAEYNTILHTPDPLANAAVNAAAVSLVAEIDKAFTVRTTKLTEVEKAVLKDRVVDLVKRARG